MMKIASLSQVGHTKITFAHTATYIIRTTIVIFKLSNFHLPNFLLREVTFPGKVGS